MKTNTQTTPTKEDALQAKNELIRAVYMTILSEVKELITLFPTDYLRTYLELDYSSINLNSKYGFYSPLIHLQLEENEGQLTITYAHNFLFKQQVGNYLNSSLSRCVYKHTAEANTSLPIEDCLSVILYNKDDFRNAKNLLDKGFKDGKKTTVESLKMEA